MPALLFAGAALASEPGARAPGAGAAEPAVAIDDRSPLHVFASTHAVPRRGHGWAAAGSVKIGPARLRAQVDRENGTVRWQLWQEVTHAGLAREMTALAFIADGEPRAANLAHVERQPERCPAQDALVTPCLTRVHYAFDMPADAVMRMTRGRSSVSLAFRDTLGRTFHGTIAPAEIAGAARTVETLRQAPHSARGLAPPPVSAAAPPRPMPDR